jgi:vacuolar protein sorting-associated protein 8
VSMDGGGRTRLVPLQRTRVAYHMVSLQWLNPRTLALLDTKEQLHVLDVRTQTELEVMDVSDVRLVYASSHFKGLATGGNVSAALAANGERACYHSVVACGQQLLLLGTRSVHALSVRPWTERVAHLVRHRRFLAALDLCLAIHDDRANAVVGLKGPKPHRKQLVKNKVLFAMKRSRKY